MIGNVASIGQFYRYLFTRYSSDLVEWVPASDSCRWSARFIGGLYVISLKFKNLYVIIVIVISLCSQTAKLWESVLYTRLSFKIQYIFPGLV